METTIRANSTPALRSTNFKGEEYPKDILEDMKDYLQIIDGQLRGILPNYVKDFIDFDNGNKIKKEKFNFSFSFNTYHRSNKRMPKDGENNEIKGLYVFATIEHGELAVMNVGISQTILRRFYQHTCGEKHNQSTLAFYLANHKHKAKGLTHEGKREDFPYEEYWYECVNAIRDFRFAIVPIDNNFQLYMAEVYLSCHYRSLWKLLKHIRYGKESKERDLLH